MEDVKIKELHLDKRGLSAELEGGACKALAEAFAQQFEKIGGDNYLEMNFSSDRGPLTVTVQRVFGMTPGAKVQKMKELIRAGDIDAALAL